MACVDLAGGSGGATGVLSLVVLDARSHAINASKQHAPSHAPPTVMSATNHKKRNKRTMSILVRAQNKRTPLSRKRQMSSFRLFPQLASSASFERRVLRFVRVLCERTPRFRSPATTIDARLVYFLLLYAKHAWVTKIHYWRGDDKLQLFERILDEPLQQLANLDVARRWLRANGVVVEHYDCLANERMLHRVFRFVETFLALSRNYNGQRMVGSFEAERGVLTPAYWNAMFHHKERGMGNQILKRANEKMTSASNFIRVGNDGTLYSALAM